MTALSTAVSATTKTKALAAAASAVAAAAVLATATLAVTTAKDPLRLLLQKSDFPAGVRYEADEGDYTNFKYRLESGGVSFESATFQGNTYTKAKGSLQVTGTVFVTPSVAQARKAFTLAKSPREVWWIGSQTSLSLPAYGDQQHARLSPAGGEGIWIGNLLVRKRTTLWALKVASERRPAISKAAFLTTLNAYARKQRARVGGG
jgi:hypothetical protein